MQYEASGCLKVGTASAGIDAIRYAEINSAKATCLFAIKVEEKYALLLDNFFEFESELLKQAEESAIWPNRDYETSMLGRLAIDRRLVNLLTASRLYLDQTDDGISRLYGNPSQELTDLKKFKNDLYDANFGYRLMEALRNHVQHSGLPVHVIGHSWSLIDGKLSGYGQHAIIPQTKPETLAENDTFKKTVLAELQKKGETVDLRGPVREYISCIVTLHEKIRSILTVKVAKDRTVYESAVAVAEYSTILDYYDSLRKHNRVNPELANSCASNSIQERA